MRLPGLFVCLAAAVTADFSIDDPVDVGRECHKGEKADPGIKFFFNLMRMEAYPFYYKGCGGNSNRFSTKQEAKVALGLIADYSACPGWIRSSGPCRTLFKEGCAATEFCMPSWPEPKCCDTATAERFRENRRAAKCGLQQQAVHRYSEDGQIFFGQNCSHNFCPKGSTCIQDEFEAYCCKDGADSGNDCQRGETGIAPGIRYYVDSERNVVYPFHYRGCGGLVRHYPTRYDAFDDRLADFFTCPGFSHYGSCVHREMFEKEEDYKHYAESHGVKLNCTGDFHCKHDPMMDFYGHCCSKSVEARYRQNREAAKCVRYESVLKYPGTQDVFFGRNCSDNFCPKNSRCIQEEFEAYCCVNGPDQGRECDSNEKGEKPGIRYFLDAERNEAYPFFYQGCGGNKNRFPNATAARNDGNPDWKMCPGFVDGQGFCDKKNPCSFGFHCQLGVNGHGKCCPNYVRDRYVKNKNASQCSPLTPQKDHKTGNVVFGRNCSHDFCERGAECIQEEFEAYCCISEPDPGHECGITEKGTTPGIRWYYDLLRHFPYPFYYKGCGGNGNRFNHYNDMPYIEDFGQCPGFGSGPFCASNRPGTVMATCPEGEYCQALTAHSVCCSTSVKKRYDHGIDPNHFCPEGHLGTESDPDNSTFILIGKSCAHNFCQPGSVCIQEEFSAYCCLM